MLSLTCRGALVNLEKRAAATSIEHLRPRCRYIRVGETERLAVEALAPVMSVVGTMARIGALVSMDSPLIAAENPISAGGVVSTSLAWQRLPAQK